LNYLLIHQRRSQAGLVRSSRVLTLGERAKYDN
jgi:hypothetical protein